MTNQHTKPTNTDDRTLLTRRQFLTWSITATVGLLPAWLLLRRVFAQQSALTPAPRPNIVLFFADDLGYADLSVQGCRDIATPQIDSIAEHGARFSSGYVPAPVCSPTRAGLLTGRYPQRFGFEHNPGPEQFAAENFGLPCTEPTLAERLKAAGYATGLIGKWHLGYREGLRPHERGFDYHFGFLGGAHTYLPGKADNDPLIRNGQPVTDEKEYLTDAFAREATAFIDRNKGNPFFLYFAFNAVHSPLEATDKYTARFPNLTGNRRTYAGMLSAMDDAVGRVLAKLREVDQEENTLIFFCSDNGGPTPQTTSRNTPLRGYKGQLYEGGIRVPFLMQWKDHIPAGVVYHEMVMAFDIAATALAAAGVPMPTDKPLDGVNLLPFLTGKQDGQPHDRLFWRASPQHAVRMGDWKLVQEPVGGVHLFNLKDDISETTDLAAKQPAKLNELQSAYATWDKEMTPAQWVRQDARNAQVGGKPKARGTSSTPRRGTRLEELFKQYDKNNDGKLTPAEFPLSTFKQVDKNNDGVLTLDEVQAYYTSRR